MRNFQIVMPDGSKYDPAAATTGPWRLHLGDCLDPVTGLASLADKSVDHVITDPPYSSTVYTRMRSPDTHSGSGTPARIGPGLKALAAGAIGNIDEMCAAVAREFARVARRWVVVFSDVEFCHRWREELEVAGLRYLRTGAWHKPDAMPQMTGDRPGTGFEPATIAHVLEEPLRWNGGGTAAVWVHGVERGDRHGHPCPKPESLMADLLADFTDPGDTILDPFAGSGTTGVAAIRLGRKFIGWEKDPSYHAAAVRRLAGTREQLVLPVRSTKAKQTALPIPNEEDTAK